MGCASSPRGRSSRSGRLGHAGLGDLFDDALDDVLPGLPPPRRRALEVALLLEEAGSRPSTRWPSASRSGARWSCLPRRDGLVVAVDDLQWLDASSEAALGFALRRLGDDVLVVWTRRLGEDDRRTAVEEALGADRIERVRVGPLSVGAIHRVLSDQLGVPVPRPTLLRLHEASGGNPMYALELARALGDEDRDARPDAATAGARRLEELVSARLDAFRRHDARGARARRRRSRG